MGGCDNLKIKVKKTNEMNLGTELQAQPHENGNWYVVEFRTKTNHSICASNSHQHQQFNMYVVLVKIMTKTAI